MIRRSLYTGLLAAGALISLYPFVWMVGTSFKSLGEAMAPSLSVLPETWLWRNYIETLEAAPFGRYFLNSFGVALAVTAGVCLTSLAAGYGLARFNFRGRDWVFGAIMATMMIPFEIVLIPNFVLISRFGWYDSYAALIVPWLANAFSVFLMRQAFLSLPKDYYDAAAIDGCGHLRFVLTLAPGLVRPMLVAVGLFAFLGSYNALIWPLVVTGDESMRVVQVGLTVFSAADGVRIQLLMCASVIVILPTVLLYFAAQRTFHDSAIATGIKG